MANADKTKLDDGTPKPPSGDAAAAELEALKKRLADQEALTASLNRELTAKDSQIAFIQNQQAHAVPPERAEALVARKNKKRKSDMTRADYEKARGVIKAAAEQEGNCKVYRTGPDMFYRQGMTYPPFSVVRLPVEEDPSFTWTPVTKKDLARAPAPAFDDRTALSDIQKGKGSRPADQQVG